MNLSAATATLYASGTKVITFAQPTPAVTTHSAIQAYASPITGGYRRHLLTSPALSSLVALSGLSGLSGLYSGGLWGRRSGVIFTCTLSCSQVLVLYRYRVRTTPGSLGLSRTATLSVIAFRGLLYADYSQKVNVFSIAILVDRQIVGQLEYVATDKVTHVNSSFVIAATEPQSHEVSISEGDCGSSPQ